MFDAAADPLCRATRLSYVAFGSDDLEDQRRFLVEFGLTQNGSDANGEYWRGQDDAPFCYVLQAGASGFRGCGFEVASRCDLETLAEAVDLPIESALGPSGGERVRLVDPDGFQVDVMQGWRTASRKPMDQGGARNEGGRAERINFPLRIQRRASEVMRLGHVVLEVTDLSRSWSWWSNLLGLIVSDGIQSRADGPVIGAFCRLNKGAEATDHHTLFLLQSGRARFNHAAFEVPSIDDLACGHDWLKANGRKHDWGIGRHILGSQIFDYWVDPAGCVLEHYADGDLFDDRPPMGRHGPEVLLGVQWGQSFSERSRSHD